MPNNTNNSNWKVSIRSGFYGNNIEVNDYILNDADKHLRLNAEGRIFDFDFMRISDTLDGASSGVAVS